jgi:hypothetical protein
MTAHNYNFKVIKIKRTDTESQKWGIRCLSPYLKKKTNF